MNSSQKSTRRQFLKGKAALDALQNLQWSAAEFERPSTARPETPSDYLIQVSRRAMACEFQVFCDPRRHQGAVEAASEALDLVDVLEDQLTVYRDHSEVARINQTASAEACPVEGRLFELISRCVDWSTATHGAFDVTAGPLVKLWGFYTRRGRFPDDSDIEQILRRVGSRHLKLDHDNRTIRFRQPGMELNLGSVGKGYALDRGAELLEAADITSFMFHGGQSSILTRGIRRENSSADESMPWTIALRHPLRPERRLAELVVRDQAVGTSGSGQQFFYHKGRRYGHVIDPRSGVPAQGVLSATVLAPGAAEADVLATAFFVLGVDETAAYCQHRPDLSVIFVLPGTRQGTVAIETIADDDVVRLLDQ